MYTCTVCKNENSNKKFIVHELMFGYNEEFIYWECYNCKRLEIDKTPDNLEKFYPDTKYYSFTNKIDYTDSPKSLKNRIEKLKFDFLLYGKNKLAGKILSLNYKAPEFYEWLKISGINPDSAILDVGCGDGVLLDKLRRMSFTNLTGADPFNKKTIEVKGMSIYDKNIFEIDGQYDFIMSHHSFEHMPDPEMHLQRLEALLKPGGMLLIRTPVTNSYCWEKYGTNWVGIDAPRHLHIESHKSKEILCHNAGLKIIKIKHDAKPFIF